MKVSCPEERAYKVVVWLAYKDERGRMVNYRKFATLKRMCERAADEGWRVTRGRGFFEAEKRGWKITDEMELFERDHDYWSVLTRYMAMQSPKITRSVGFCDAPIDKAPLLKIWRELMPPDWVLKIMFVFESWKDAKKSVALEDVSAA